MSADALAMLRTKDAIELLTELVRIPSTSGAEKQAADFLVSRLAAFGFPDVKRDGAGNVLVTMRGSAPGPARAFFSHFDSAGVGNMSEPFEARVLPGDAFAKPGPVLRGLGASVPKSAVAALVAAAVALRRAGEPRTGVIYLAIVTKDMHGNHAGPREITASFPFDVEWMVASEPSSNQIVLGARGINHYRLEFDGLASHNGRPREGANPLYAVAHLLDELRTLELPVHPVLGPATVSPFEIGSEAAPPLSPHRAHLMLDRRTLPGESTADVQRSVEALADRAVSRNPGVSRSVRLMRAMHSLDTPPDAPIVERLQASVTQRLGRALGTTYITFSSNAAFGVIERGWEAVGFGPGSINDVGPNEHVSLHEVEEAARIYTAMMLA